MSITRLPFLVRMLSPEQIITPRHKSNRYFYVRERGIYRITHSMVKMGHPLKQRDYYFYKLIAEKYGWPYIKEPYDNAD